MSVLYAVLETHELTETIVGASVSGSIDGMRTNRQGTKHIIKVAVADVGLPDIFLNVHLYTKEEIRLILDSNEWS